jgi:hypothetical protein
MSGLEGEVRAHGFTVGLPAGLVVAKPGSVKAGRRTLSVVLVVVRPRGGWRWPGKWDSEL